MPRYDQGNALIRASRSDDASKAYADALRSTDLLLQSRAYFNRGNALAQMCSETRELGYDLMWQGAPEHAPAEMKGVGQPA